MIMEFPSAISARIPALYFVTYCNTYTISRHLFWKDLFGFSYFAEKIITDKVTWHLLYNISDSSVCFISDIVKGNLKVVLALCHCLYRHFGSSQGNCSPGNTQLILKCSVFSVSLLYIFITVSIFIVAENHQVHHVREEGHLAALFGWVSRMTGKQVTDFQR